MPSLLPSEFSLDPPLYLYIKLSSLFSNWPVSFAKLRLFNDALDLFSVFLKGNMLLRLMSSFNKLFQATAPLCAIVFLPTSVLNDGTQNLVVFLKLYLCSLVLVNNLLIS